MTRVSILKGADGAVRGFEMKGHAMMAEYGKDIVCAALSMLAINTVNSIESLTDDKIKVKSDSRKGLIRCVSTAPLSESGKLLMSSFELGIRAVEEQYGKEFVVLEFREV